MPCTLVHERERNRPVGVLCPLKHQTGDIVRDTAELCFGLGEGVLYIFGYACRIRWPVRSLHGGAGLVALRLRRTLPALRVGTLIRGVRHGKLRSDLMFGEHIPTVEFL